MVKGSPWLTACTSATSRKASELLSEDTSVLPPRPRLRRVRFYNAAVVQRSVGLYGGQRQKLSFHSRIHSVKNIFLQLFHKSTNPLTLKFPLSLFVSSPPAQRVVWIRNRRLCIMRVALTVMAGISMVFCARLRAWFRGWRWFIWRSAALVFMCCCYPV